MTAGAGLSAGKRLAVLALVAVAARAITFGNPIVHVDEQFYLAAAKAMWGGAWPYADVWDRKPVGLFLLYLPPAALPLPYAIWAYQAVALAAAVASAFLIDRLARRADWHAGALLAGAAYLLWINLAEGQGGQAPILYNPLVAGAALLIAHSHVSHGRAAAAMLLMGIALQVKTSVVFEGVWFGLWLLWRHWQAHRRFVATTGYAAQLAGVAMLPTASVAAVFAAAGRFEPWWYANVVSALQRNPDPRPEQLANLVGCVLILSPLVAMAGLALAEARRRGASPTQLFLFGWLGAALFGLLVFGAWYEHYTLPVMVPACVLSAWALGEHRRVRRWALPLLAAVAIGGQATLAAKRHTRGRPGEFTAVVEAIGRGPGCLWVYSGYSLFYPASGRCRVSRYLFPSHLYRMREQGAIGVDQKAEVRRILAAQPAVIVMRQARGERPDIRALVDAAIARDYREAAALPLGAATVRVFQRR